MAMLNEKLTEYLESSNLESVVLSFSEIQSITGLKLTGNALSNSTYWGNGSKLSKYWKNAGYITTHPKKEISKGRVIFSKMQNGIMSENAKTAKSHSGGISRTRDKRNCEANPKNFVYNNEPTFNPPAPQINSTKGKLVLSDLTLKEYTDKVMLDTSYGAESQLIRTILKRFPENTDSEIVALKVSLIDLTNTTQLSRAKNKLSLKDIVDKIVNTKDFDERVKQGDKKLISDLAKSCKTDFGYNPFSFMSKYCTYHNTEIYGNDDYSIYDNVLKNNLPKYIENLNANDIDKWRDSCDYESYWQCIDGLLKYIKCNIKNKRRALDYCIWYYYRPDTED